MFVRTPNSYNQLELNIHNAFEYYKNDIFTYHHSVWNEEDIEGKANCILHKLGKYNLAIMYVSLIWLDVQMGVYTWDNIKTRYAIDTMKACFTCDGINLKKLLEIYGLEIQETGIENMGLEESFFIEENQNETYLLTDALLVYYNSIQNQPCIAATIKSFE